jgi:hypothetical protein
MKNRFQSSPFEFQLAPLQLGTFFEPPSPPPAPPPPPPPTPPPPAPPPDLTAEKFDLGSKQRVNAAACSTYPYGGAIVVEGLGDDGLGGNLAVEATLESLQLNDGDVSEWAWIVVNGVKMTSTTKKSMVKNGDSLSVYMCAPAEWDQRRGVKLEYGGQQDKAQLQTVKAPSPPPPPPSPPPSQPSPPPPPDYLADPFEMTGRTKSGITVDADLCECLSFPAWNMKPVIVEGLGDTLTVPLYALAYGDDDVDEGKDDYDYSSANVAQKYARVLINGNLTHGSNMEAQAQVKNGDRIAVHLCAGGVYGTNRSVLVRFGNQSDVITVATVPPPPAPSPPPSPPFPPPPPLPPPAGAYNRPRITLISAVCISHYH